MFVDLNKIFDFSCFKYALHGLSIEICFCKKGVNIGAPHISAGTFSLYCVLGLFLVHQAIPSALFRVLAFINFLYIIIPF